MPSDKMDGTDKAAIGCVIFVCLAIAVVLGVGTWAFIELIQWVTSK